MPASSKSLDVSRKTYKPLKYLCPLANCPRRFSTTAGRTNHVQTMHPFHVHVTPSAPPSLTSHPSHDFDPDHNSPPPPNSHPNRNNDFDEAHQPKEKPFTVKFHPKLNGLPCNSEGNFLPPNTHPSPPEPALPDDWTPFEHRMEFELADFLFREEQISAEEPPFANPKELYETIDRTAVGDVPWQSFSVSFNGKLPTEGDIPPWMTEEFEVWYRDPEKSVENMLKNPEFNEEFDYSAKRMFDVESGEQIFKDYMSGNHAWNDSDEIAKDSATHGSMLCHVICGSDKTTVSVATGQNDFYPLYTSIGNIHNNVRRAHRNGVALTAFLAVPHTDREYANDNEFRTFCRQLFHSSLEHIFRSLHKGMTTPQLKLCPDGHYRRVIYGFGPYIADYPEQVLLTCVVSNWCPKCDLDGTENIALCCPEHNDLLKSTFTLKELWNNYGIITDVLPFTSLFPRANIHQLISPDLLHQVIKGTFKDHLVEWVTEYINITYGSNAKAVLADIDRRIAAVPPFPGLRCFKEGRNFKQWTGNDSKALMKVYLPAIQGHIPDQMVQALSHFLEFCYLARRNVIDTDTLKRMDIALNNFHRDHVIFDDVLGHSNCTNSLFSLPRQHSLSHYTWSIRAFGAPNGLCTSITESKHIKAIKEPWQQSSRYLALGQMLLTNQCLDKLAAAQGDFRDCGMLDASMYEAGLQFNDAVTDVGNESTTPGACHEDAGPVDGAQVLGKVLLAKKPFQDYPTSPTLLATAIHQLDLPKLIRQYLYGVEHPDCKDVSLIDPVSCPPLPSRIRTFPSAKSIFFAPSNQSGVGGMYKEYIHSVPAWYKQNPRYDCVFVSQDADTPVFKGMYAAQVFLSFSFIYEDVVHSCTLIHSFSVVASEPDNVTGMWIVQPDKLDNGRWLMSVIHIDSIFRGAHLIPVFGDDFIPTKHILSFHHSLDKFRCFYVNKYADHHAYEVIF
ncbi:hypothetical protein BT96DRAFT_967702 [Gymnopus androsaceus JB14]|uniref:C2H2-type domain-containing protein n=1 Tax=Gymnopus androsaceus JB14 TaxID=1447944 RepID=A0A6A4GY69_9AGAR|nr:hypothetical protein BT96DRAFT_967702 [Gymnopus androsaceus JB14]